MQRRTIDIFPRRDVRYVEHVFGAAALAVRSLLAAIVVEREVLEFAGAAV